MKLLALVFAAACSVHAADYLVSGVVVDSQSQKPLANTHVSLAPTSTRAQKMEQFTRQDGRFSFAVRETGKYTLQVTKPGYPVQFYAAPAFVGLSSAVVVRDDQDTSHILFLAKRGAAITGQVNDEDSEPVKNALVTIFQSMIVRGERKIVIRGQMRANAVGQFRFASLIPGDYYVCAMGRPWFADSLIQIEQMQEALGKPLSRTAPLSSHQVEPSDQQQEPEPGPDAVPPPAPSVPQFSPDPNFHGTAFLTTFYPSAPTIEEASLVHLDVGGESRLSIALTFAKAVSVKGRVSISGDMSAGRLNLLKKAYDQYLLFLQETVAKDGEFEFKNVPAGIYEIVGASESASGTASWSVRQDVVVGTSDLGVNLQPGSMGAFSGRLIFEGKRPPPTSPQFVMLRNDEGHGVRVQADPEGSFSFSRILPGRYEVAAGSTDYVGAYLSGPSGERLPLTLEIIPGEAVHRDLALTQAMSTIAGTVEKAGSPLVGALVILIPKDPSARWAYGQDQTDSDGSFRMVAIPSGDYFLLALTDGPNIAYREPKVREKLVSRAKPVHIESGDHLDLKLDPIAAATVSAP